MLTLEKKLVVDEAGNPTEVIISWKDFLIIEELLGLDLDAEAIDDLETARQDREKGNVDAYIDLDDIE